MLVTNRRSNVRHRARYRWFSCLLSVLLVVGCGSSDSTDQSGAAEAAVGDTISLPYISDITGINELTSQSATLAIGLQYYALFMPLATERADFESGPPSFAAGIAESWDFSDDRKTLTFHLRRDLVWSDGEPIDADDVLFTWQAQTDPSIAWSWVDYKRRISDVEVVDAHTVAFHFSEIYATQLHDSVQGVILPQHKWGQLPFEEWKDNGQWFVDNLVVKRPLQSRVVGAWATHRPGAERSVFRCAGSPQDRPDRLRDHSRS